MYTRLSLRNVRRSLRNYAIYFTTLTLITALMYSFLALSFSNAVQALAENISLLTNGLLLLSVIVTIVSSFITSYAVDFILTQRKKEFATYLLMGMETRTVVRLFLGESALIGLVAYLCGTALGAGLSGVLASLVMGVFDIPYPYELTISAAPLGTSFLLFLLMYSIGLLRSAKVIRRAEVIELLYDERRNEVYKERTLVWYAAYLLLSALLITAGIILLGKTLTMLGSLAILVLLLALGLVLCGIYGFYRRFPELLVKLYASRQTRVYKDANLFLYGEIRSRINSSGRVLAVIALLLTLSLLTMFVGLVMGAGYKANIQGDYPYDVTVALDTKVQDFHDVVDFISSRTPVKDFVPYYIYHDESLEADLLALSDYNRLRSQLGLDQKTLSHDQYLIHCEWSYRQEMKDFIATHSSITLKGRQLASHEDLIFSEPMEQARMVGTRGYAVIIPDEVAALLEATMSRLAVALAEEGRPELRDELNRFVRREWQPELLAAVSGPITMSVTVRAWGIANSLSGFAALSFCGLYLSVVLIVLSGTVLGFEQLSSTVRSRRAYAIIRQLGVTDLEQNKLIARELALFFLIPTLLPCTLLLLLAGASQSLFAAYILKPFVIPLYAVVTLLVFGVVYGLYFAGTYYVFRRAVCKSG